jgi:hypothetical protein
MNDSDFALTFGSNADSEDPPPQLTNSQAEIHRLSGENLNSHVENAGDIEGSVMYEKRIRFGTGRRRSCGTEHSSVETETMSVLGESESNAATDQNYLQHDNLQKSLDAAESHAPEPTGTTLSGPAPYALVNPGTYRARPTRLIGPTLLRTYGRMSVGLAVQLIDAPEIEVVCFMNLSSGPIPRGSNFYRAWTIANGAPPEPGQNMEPEVLLRPKLYEVEVGDNRLDQDGRAKPEALLYSVVRKINRVVEPADSVAGQRRSRAASPRSEPRAISRESEHHGNQENQGIIQSSGGESSSFSTPVVWKPQDGSGGGGKSICAQGPPGEPITPEQMRAIEEVFWFYIETVNGNLAVYSLTQSRIAMALPCLKTALRMSMSHTLEGAVDLMKMAVEELSRSDWHMGRHPKTKNGARFCDWKHVFGSKETFQIWVQSAIEREG